MIRKALFAAALLAVNCAAQADAVLFSEDFDNVATLPGSGWSQINNSTPGGVSGWFQGDYSTLEIAAHDSEHPTFVGANFLNASPGGNVSNWLITPTLTLINGETLTFYTRSNGAGISDRLEVRLSTNGASADVGGTNSSVGDFSTLLAAINPTLTPGGYPSDWTLFSISLAGVADFSLGRLAFRYFITDTNGPNGDSIGIDTFRVNVPEPSTLAMFALALLALVWIRGEKRRILARRA